MAMPYDYMPAATPDYSTPADIQRAQKAALAEYGVNAGIGTALGAGQLGLSLIDTDADKANKAELKKLEELAKRGKLGLTGGERQAYEDTLMNPVRSLASQTQAAEEARLAAGGNASAADVARSKREAERRVTEASLAAGQHIEQAELQRAAEQRQELNERLATESGRQRQRIELIGKTLAGLAANVGKVAAGMAVPAQMTDSQVIALVQAKDARGNAIYPGLQGKSLPDVRALLESGQGGGLSGQSVRSGYVPGANE